MMMIPRLGRSAALVLLCGAIAMPASAQGVDTPSSSAEIAALRNEMVDALRRNNHRDWVMARRQIDALRNAESQVASENVTRLRPVPVLLSSAETMSLAEYASVAKQLNVPAYRILDQELHILSKAQTLTLLGDRFSEPPTSGTVESGFLMNTSDEIVFVAIGDSLDQGIEPYMIHPGELIAVKVIDDYLTDGSGCSVSCGESYFACCNAGSCFCYSNGNEPAGGCSAGGHGAVSCSYESTGDTGEDL